MRAHPFPQIVYSDGEASYESGTPGSVYDDIPIDPALGGPVTPFHEYYGQTFAFGDELQPPTNDQLSQIAGPSYSYPSQDLYPQQSQAPQGDIFPPPQISFYPTDTSSMPTPKPRKRRKIRRREGYENNCDFCHGNGEVNAAGVPELMLTCDECRRSGHPSCLKLIDIDHQALRSYPWKCIECKNCEICQQKGDDSRMLFCDSCDRGWHMYCLDPPIEEPPSGIWHCPLCPPLIDVEQFSPPDPTLELPIRDLSVASSSKSVIAPMKVRNRSKDKGKERTRGLVVNGHGTALDHIAPLELTRSSSRACKKEDSPQKRKRSPARIKLRLKGKGKANDEDQPKGMFDDYLSPEDRDTSKTTIMNWDKQRFERARSAADAKLVPPQPRLDSEHADASLAGPSSRPLRSAFIQAPTISESPAPSSTPGFIPALPPGTLRISRIRFGEYDIKTWYDAPFPEEYANISDGRLWICEFCLKYMKSRFGADRHRYKCKMWHPPGDEIYRDGLLSIFEVDGRKNKIYCQNLCLLSKMFLDHKSLFYDVEPFLFYVITEADAANHTGQKFVGYFSKEKRSPKDYNVSCIMTLPVRQRQGWGNFLIDFSYLLSKKEGRLGSPEKPLSSLGALGYKNYWTLAIMRFFHTAPNEIRMADICKATSITLEDVYFTLSHLGMITVYELPASPVKLVPGQSMRISRGRKSNVARRTLQRTQTNEKAEDKTNAPFVAPTRYELHWDRKQVEEYLQRWESKGYLKLKPEKLKWSPYLISRTMKTEAMEAIETDDIESTTTVTNGVSPRESADKTSEERSLSVEPRPTRSRKETAQMERDRILAEDMTRSPSRKLRSAGTPVPLIFEDTTHFTPSKRGRGRPRLRPVADHATPPMRVALEEHSNGRQLRSRNREPEVEKPDIDMDVDMDMDIIIPKRRTSPRKRRRIESPSEEGSSPPPSNRLPSTNKEDLPRLIGDISLNTTHLEDDGDAKTVEDIVLAASSRATISVEPSLINGAGVKWEDAGTPTPLTSLTSRQSMPSDDTLVVALNKVGVLNHEDGLAEDDLDADGDFDYEDLDADAEGDDDPDHMPT